MDVVVQLWPTLRKGSHKLPLPTPVSLTREALGRLSPNQYVVGVKNDGVRAVALCMLDEKINYIKLINRKGKEKPGYFQKGKDQKLGEPNWKSVAHRRIQLG